MDFTLDEGQQAIADLALQILSDKLSGEQLSAIDATDDWFAREEWAELAKSDLLGIALPESVGGGGYGFLGACLVTEAVGRTVAPLPYVPTVVLGALPIAEFGTDEQQTRFLPKVVSGESVLTAALVDDGSLRVSLDPAVAATRSTGANGAWRLSGAKTFVPAAHLAERILVPASDGEHVRVFLVDPSVDGVRVERQTAITGEPLALVRLDDVRVGEDDVLGGLDADGEAITSWVADRALAASCILQVGVCDGALRKTANYTSTRQQFGSPIATFQAVAQRAADAYIDTETVRLTAWQAAWRLDERLDAAAELAMAKFFCGEAAQRVVHAAQHLHGGIGMDTDYGLYRYFRWAKQNELTLGGGTRQLVTLGQLIADGSAA